MHTSPTRYSSGKRSFRTRMARWTTPSSAQAPLPYASLWPGTPKSIILSTPAESISSALYSSLSTL